MAYQETEADARINIDALLRQAGWDPANKAQVRTEVQVVLQSSTGRADYVLYDQRGRPLAVIEAKKRGIQPYIAKQQTLPYAKQLAAPFIFLTDGDLIYFWDYQNDDARQVRTLFARRDLERLLHAREERKPLATIEIPHHYFRQDEARQVRPYQREAMQALDHALELGKRRFLIELPTGTGKTDVILLYLQRLIQANRAERILFLVDREQLAIQALSAFQDILTQHSSYWLKPGVQRQEQQITVCLLQTMISRYQEFTSGYFDVVVMDECHRSIYGAWQQALLHFDALHIGLTATPAAYIERNTYAFYQCKDEQPDFAYSIAEAFAEGYLIPYRFATAITHLVAKGTEIGEGYYDPAAFEREWTNEQTNKLMMREFDELAHATYHELAPGQRVAPGKSIVFAITKHHAARLCEYLNQLHPALKGNYAAVITSDVADPDELIRKFKFEDYPQVAVTVGMLDTGFDCREIVHLVLCRAVRSPILYRQMRGRGTRTAPHIDKQRFVIYDFFRNFEYFNDSDIEIFSGSGKGDGQRSAVREKRADYQPRELVELGLQDEWLESISYVEVGPEGERIDKRNYVTAWEQAIQHAVTTNPILQKVRDNTPLTEAEEQDLVDRLNRPEHFFNETNLRNAYRYQSGTLIDFIKVALGTTKLKTREEVLNEAFHAWLVSRNFTPEQAKYLVQLKNRGIALGKLQLDDLFLPPFSLVNMAALGVELFGEKGLKETIEAMDAAVFAQQRDEKRSA